MELSRKVDIVSKEGCVQIMKEKFELQVCLQGYHTPSPVQFHLQSHGGFLAQERTLWDCSREKSKIAITRMTSLPLKTIRPPRKLLTIFRHGLQNELEIEYRFVVQEN